MTNKERAKKVADILKDQDMTMARLQRRTTLHINTIRNLLSGECSPTTDTLKQVAGGLGIKTADLL